MADMKSFLAKVASGEKLTREDAEAAFNVIMSGEATPTQIGGFLMALRVRGESVDEIAGAVCAMRGKMTKVEAPEGAIDIVGTGGDASGTLNISTCSAFVVAGAGVPVAKHGNRALSSKSGAADTLAALGVKIELKPEEISKCIREAGIGFMFAPAHHSAMRHVGPSRVELGTRTVFNLLGPLCNPASVKRYMLGVFAREWVEPIADVLSSLGAERAWVVHGSFGDNGGIDEISLTGISYVAELRNGRVRSFQIEPADFQVDTVSPKALLGGAPAENARALRAVLEGELGAFRDVAIMNAGAALMVAGKAELTEDAAKLARQSIDSGRALKALDRLVEVSNG
ncbi:MAG: anthranilate phosphoribosyltransferase [Propylenella sp.]